MGDALERHTRLTEELLSRRRTGELTGAQDEAMCDELAELWRLMSDEERQQADTRLMWTREDIERVTEEATRFDPFFEDGKE